MPLKKAPSLHPDLMPRIFNVGTRLLQNAPGPPQLQPSGSPLKSSQEKSLGKFSVKILALFELPGCQVKKGNVMSC